jgi:microcystin-dependent protein
LAKQFGSAILLPKDPVAPLEAATKQYVDAAVAGGGGDPPLIGQLVMWPTLTAPSAKWLLCNGTAVSRTTYATLFALIGTTYGAGDGTTTFNLPNLQDRFPVGVGGLVLADRAGSASHLHSVPNHAHGADTGSTGSGHTHVVPNIASSGSHDHGGGTIQTNTQTTGTGANRVSVVPSSGSAHTHTVSDANTTGSGHIHNITSQTGVDTGTVNQYPPYLAVNFIIRALP